MIDAGGAVTTAARRQAEAAEAHQRAARVAPPDICSPQAAGVLHDEWGATGAVTYVQA
ncbi:MAG: hypothetical protein OEW44_00020 [Gemmatimonadota bacterium]|nr:hypothetical protein [Gemmatimonadota bacterium]